MRAGDLDHDALLDRLLHDPGDHFEPAAALGSCAATGSGCLADAQPITSMARHRFRRCEEALAQGQMRSTGTAGTTCGRIATQKKARRSTSQADGEAAGSNWLASGLDYLTSHSVVSWTHPYVANKLGLWDYPALMP
jgi:hypothetical protein